MLFILNRMRRNLCSVFYFNCVLAFFAEKKKLMKEKFPQARLQYFKGDKLEYTLGISGLYNEEIMTEFVDVLGEDFCYIFSGFKISDVNYI